MDTIKWVATYLACLLFMIMVATSVASSMRGVLGDSEAAGMVIGIPLMFAVFIGPIFITNWVLGKANEVKGSIEKKAKNYVDKKKKEESIKLSKKEYENAKHSFKYLSDDKLKNKYEDMKNKKDSTEKLALEEELVDRGILDYSPMHEKMQNIKDRFG